MESQSPHDASISKAPSLRACHNCLHPCLPEQARCPECGAFQHHTDEARPSPGVAGVLSFLIPGLGHFYLARPIRGVCWLFAAPIVWWWAAGAVRTSFFLPMLPQTSWKGLALRGSVLLFHALAAVHAIQQGQPRHDTQRGRMARSWLLRLGLAGIAALFISSYALPRLRDYWAWVFPVSATLNPAPAPIVPPSAPKPFFDVRITRVSFLPDGDLKLQLNIQNTSPWTVEKGILHVKSGDGKLYGSISLAYLGLQKSQKATVTLDQVAGTYPSGFDVEGADILTIDGLKDCVVAHDSGFVVLRLLSSDPLEDGRSLATFQIYNFRSSAIQIGTLCGLMPVWVEKRYGRGGEVLVLPAIPAGGVGEAKLAFEHELAGVEIESRDNYLYRGAMKIEDARVLEYNAEGAPVEDARSVKSKSDVDEP